MIKLAIISTHEIMSKITSPNSSFKHLLRLSNLKVSNKNSYNSIKIKFTSSFMEHLNSC